MQSHFVQYYFLLFIGYVIGRYWNYDWFSDKQLGMLAFCVLLAVIAYVFHIMDKMDYQKKSAH